MRLLADIRLGRKLLGGFALVLLLPVIVTLAAYRTTSANAEASQAVAKTLRVIALAEAAQADLIDMETAYRGFLLTGVEEFLAPYDEGRLTYRDRLAALEVETSDNQEQLARWATIADRAQEWQVETTGPRMALRRQVASGQPPSAELVSLVGLGEGRRQFDSIRKLFNEAIAAEQALLELRLAAANRSNEALFRTLGVGTALALLIGVAVSSMLTRDITSGVERLAAAAQAIGAGQLDRRAGLTRRDEIGQTAASFDHMAAELQTTIVQLEHSTSQLLRNQAELERSNRELQDFATVASHDLQEPIRKVQAFGDRLASRYGASLGEQGSDYLARMLDAAARMQTLINDLLTFSRVSTRAQPFSRVNLNETAKAVLSDLDEQVRRSGGRVELEPLPTIDADPTQMRQLLQNLVSNALKFRNPEVGSVVRISSAQPRDGRVSISVADNGIGFDEKYLDRIFTIFQRLHGRGEYEGTGIGLAVCRKIVERHGGSMTATSTPGKGATFIVDLPITQPVMDQPVESSTQRTLEAIA